MWRLAPHLVSSDVRNHIRMEDAVKFAITCNGQKWVGWPLKRTTLGKGEARRDLRGKALAAKMIDVEIL